MATLLEQFNQLKEKETQEVFLADKIKELAEKPHVMNLLKAGLSNEFVGQVKRDSGLIATLEPAETSQFSGYDSYQFTIEPKVTEVDLEVRIFIDGRAKAATVTVVEYNEKSLTIENVMQLLKEVIGVEDKVKTVK
mgnify:CR=1 FL=1